MGDFGRYVLQPALRDIITDDPKALEHEAERAVFERALELGWTPERFGEIDKGRRLGREDSPVERVGKKYQWIGFYEVLGRIADHLAIKRSWSDDEPRRYTHAEQLVWRDIDPTVLVRKPAASSTPQVQWFSPAEVRFPPSVVDDYPRDMTGVPDPMDSIVVSDAASVPWLVLGSTQDWKQPLAPEIEALRVPQLYIWMHLHAYLIPVAQAAELTAWAKGKDWFGRWMPEMAEPHNVLLGAHPDDPEWSAADGSVDWWDVRAGGTKPAELLHCAGWYGGTGTSRDASAEDETRGYVPSRRLLEVLDLSRGVDFRWRDTFGLAVCDPSVLAGGPAALVMRRDLISRLADAGLTLFWTALIGNESHRNDYGVPGDDYRWVSASASYILQTDRVEQIAATAARYMPGPTVEQVLTWAPRQVEA